MRWFAVNGSLPWDQSKGTELDLFIFGVGFSGIEIAKAASTQSAKVAGTTRKKDKVERLGSIGVEPFLFDGTGDLDLIQKRLKTVTHLIISIAPDADGDPVLNALNDVIAGDMPALGWIGYLSTVGVYGDHHGAWVNEESVCKPVSARSIERLKAEDAWQGLATDIRKPLAIMRLSGIYGPGRNTFVNLADGSAKRIIKARQYFNRIHVADIAGAAMLLAGDNIGGLFNVTDDEPAPPQDVVTYAAKLMGVNPPPEIAYDDAVMSEMARSFYGEVKRVSNAKIKDLGYEFLFPNYRIAQNEMWQNQHWK